MLTALDGNQDEYHIKLYQPWFQTEVEAGDTINVIGNPEASNGGERVYIVDGEKNLLVVHPDLLIPGTPLSKYSDCARSSYLQMKTLVQKKNVIRLPFLANRRRVKHRTYTWEHHTRGRSRSFYHRRVDHPCASKIGVDQNPGKDCRNLRGRKR